MSTQTRTIRTIVVDDSPVALGSLCALVSRQESLLFVGAATNGRDALNLARNLSPDLVLLDLEMPVMGGIEAMAYLGRECPAAQVVVVTVHDSPELRKLCCQRGARAFIKKDTIHEQLPIVIQQLFGS